MSRLHYSLTFFLRFLIAWAIFALVFFACGFIGGALQHSDSLAASYNLFGKAFIIFCIFRAVIAGLDGRYEGLLKKVLFVLYLSMPIKALSPLFMPIATTDIMVDTITYPLTALLAFTLVASIVFALRKVFRRKQS